MDASASQRGALSALALGAILMTAGGMDAPWQLWTNRDASAAPDAAFSGPWRAARLMLILAGGTLVVAAAALLWATRDRLAE